jgi:hypothetical protein
MPLSLCLFVCSFCLYFTHIPLLSSLHYIATYLQLWNENENEKVSARVTILYQQQPEVAAENHDDLRCNS